VSNDLSVRFTLLDQQLVDANDLPLGRIDDLELDEGETPAVVAVLTGTQALGERVDGVFGRWVAAVSERLRPPSARSGPTRIGAELIEEVEPLVRLSAPFDELRVVAALERWLASRVVEPLPGAGDAGQ
jgi:hypothetical protein